MPFATRTGEQGLALEYVSSWDTERDQEICVVLMHTICGFLIMCHAVTCREKPPAQTGAGPAHPGALAAGEGEH